MQIVNMAAILLIVLSSTVFAASIEKAEIFRQHGLVAESKKELIDLIFSKATEKERAEAYYLLGTIAFEEQNISSALDTWRDLVQKFPSSAQARIVKDRIAELAEIVGQVSRVSVDNAVAESYLRHADFWSEGKDTIFKIDSSWIPKVDAAIKWYDKVIQEYPKTTASRIAYEGKMRTLLGWEEPGRDGDSYGVRHNVSHYMPQLLEAFAAFEKDHPEAVTLQAFRYQIVQAYWSGKNWAKTREWLNIIVEKSGEIDTFYRDLAKRRLAKVEY